MPKFPPDPVVVLRWRSVGKQKSRRGFESLCRLHLSSWWHRFWRERQRIWSNTNERCYKNNPVLSIISFFSLYLSNFVVDCKWKTVP